MKPKMNSELFFKKLKMKRLELGLSQNAVGEILGIDASQWGRIERGLAHLSLPRYMKVAELLGIGPDFLEETEPEKAEDANRIYLTRRQMLAAQILSSLLKDSTAPESYPRISVAAVKAADELLKALE